MQKNEWTMKTLANLQINKVSSRYVKIANWFQVILLTNMYDSPFAIYI